MKSHLLRGVRVGAVHCCPTSPGGFKSEMQRLFDAVKSGALPANTGEGIINGSAPVAPSSDVTGKEMRRAMTAAYNTKIFRSAQ